MRAGLSEATVDIRKGNVVSNEPVQLKMLQGQLNANHLEVVNSGDLVRFTKGVTLVLQHLGDASAAPSAKAGAK